MGFYGLSSYMYILFVVAFISSSLRSGGFAVGDAVTNTVKTSPKLEWMLIDEQRRIILDWSAKSACSKVVEMFYEQMGIHRGVHYTGFIHNYRMAHHHNATQVTESMLYDPAFYKFKVTRNPYDRAVSSYIHSMITIIKDNIFRDKSEYLQDKENTSFTRFLEWFRESNDTLYASDHYRMQSHEHEHERWKQGKGSIFNRIVKVEDFDSGMKLVNADKGTNYSYPANDDHHYQVHNVSVTEYAGDTPISKLRETPMMPPYSNFYNAKTKLLVQQIYQWDLLLYDYAFPTDWVSF
jgi:hypothetical protein